MIKSTEQIFYLNLDSIVFLITVLNSCRHNTFMVFNFFSINCTHIHYDTFWDFGICCVIVLIEIKDQFLVIIVLDFLVSDECLKHFHTDSPDFNEMHLFLTYLRSYLIIDIVKVHMHWRCHKDFFVSYQHHWCVIHNFLLIKRDFN